MSTDSQIIEKKKVNIKPPKEPGKFKVVVFNDEVTPIEFVVAMLISVFKHQQATAFDLTLKVHNDGSAVAGTYAHEIAEQKAVDATDMARANGYPLVLRVEAE